MVLLRNIACISSALSVAIVVSLAGCAKHQAPQEPQMQAMRVQVMPVALSSVPNNDEYVATIKSRRSATINPQVDGNLTQIQVRSGDHVKAGQVLMVIDPYKQEATVETQRQTENQKKAVYDYNQIQVVRQRKLFEAGVISRDALDQAEQAFSNSKADYESSVASRVTQERQLSYYRIAAPFDGVVGDIPVHVGDYVSPSTMLTTVDENRDLEAYIYVPAERALQVRQGLNVSLIDNRGKLLEKTKINFLSPQVDSQLQGILVKAPVHSSYETLRNAQLVKAQITWSSAPAPLIPVLSVIRIGGANFVYVAEQQDGKYVAQQRTVQLGDTVGNSYAVLDGLKQGDKLIVSGMQFLVNGMPVQPLG
jgi:RND family efflux transporter MFP subunit